jgi:hypothetical protein
VLANPILLVVILAILLGTIYFVLFTEAASFEETDFIRAFSTLF